MLDYTDANCIYIEEVEDMALDKNTLFLAKRFVGTIQDLRYAINESAAVAVQSC